MCDKNIPCVAIFLCYHLCLCVCVCVLSHTSVYVRDFWRGGRGHDVHFLYNCAKEEALHTVFCSVLVYSCYDDHDEESTKPYNYGL